MGDTRGGPQKRKPVNISEQFIDDLRRLSDAEATTQVLDEKDFPEIKFPIRYNPDKKIGYRRVWNEDEVRKFYENPENVRRTIYCRNINVDELDDWGMFGYTPGFIFIEKSRYKGIRTPADRAASVGLSIAVDRQTGLGVMNHFDFFPKYKFEYVLVKKDSDRKLFELMCDIFSVKKMGESGQKSPLLGSGGKSV